MILELDEFTMFRINATNKSIKMTLYIFHIWISLKEVYKYLIIQMLRNFDSQDSSITDFYVVWVLLQLHAYKNRLYIDIYNGKSESTKVITKLLNTKE